MQAHSASERSVWYALLIMPGILPGHRLTTPFQTVSKPAGATLWIVLAALEVVRWCVRLDFQRVVNLLIRKQAAHRDHPVFGLADVGQLSPAYTSGMPIPLVISMLVYYKHTLLVWGCLQLFEH